MPKSNGVQKRMNIGTHNESSLHSDIKKWYFRPGDMVEEKHEGSIIDIKRGNTLIEIQTKNFYAISKKLRSLLKSNKVILVHPIAEEKNILKVSDKGEVLSRRKSNKKGKIEDLFTELMRVPDIMCMENLTLEVLMIKAEEIRCDDGKGSWRRKGVSIVDRRLIEVVSSHKFHNKYDLVELLPKDMSQPFTNKELAKMMKVSRSKASKITYCFRKMGLIEEVGKRGRELLLQKIEI